MISNVIVMLSEKHPPVSALTAWNKAKNSQAVLIDIRQKTEITETGCAQYALTVERDYLEFKIENLAFDCSKPIFILCKSGARAALAAHSLRSIGYENTTFVQGGMDSWIENDLPRVFERSLSQHEHERYLRQISIPQIGEKNQLKLLDSKVLIVGAGGLGSAVALYLAAAGVGTISLVDHDKVELSNLHRQIIHCERNIGKAKVHSAKKRILSLNSNLNVITAMKKFTEDTAEQLTDGFDIIVDGTDNFETKYLLNKVCVKNKLPLVFGSIHRFEGQVSMYNPKLPYAPCYKCIFPNTPPKEFAPSCAQAGVLGVMPGMIGIIQATEVIKFLIDLGSSLCGYLLMYHALLQDFFKLEVSRNEQCPLH